METFFCACGYDYNQIILKKLSYTANGGFSGLSDNFPKLVGFIF